MIFERASLDFFLFILIILYFYDVILSTFLHSNWIMYTQNVGKIEARRQVQEKGGLIKSSRMKVGKQNIHELSVSGQGGVYDKKKIFLNVM